jgi:hypothetical protein
VSDQTPPRSDLLNRWGALKRERESWRLHWAEITQYLLPRNGRYFVQDRNRGWRRHNNIFDSTGTKALNTLAAGMMAGMTSPARPWFRLATADPDMMKAGPAKVWLDDVTKIILDIFQKGNTYRALHAIYKELGAFGTGATVVLDDYQDVMRHYTLTAGEYCIAQDWRGNVCTLYREFEKTVSEMVKEFGRENCSVTVRSLYDRGQLDSWVPIIHAIEPRHDRDPKLKDSKNMPFSSTYFEVAADKGQFLRESGFEYFPVLAPRWDVAGGDVYGNSPGMEALGDIKQLQQQQLRKGQGIDFMTKPPLQLPTSMKNREIDALPGGISYLDNTGTPATRNLFQVQLDLSHLLADIQDVRVRINSTFFADLFLMLANQTDSRMTATEVAERHEEKLLMLGPVLERLNDELLSPLVDMTFKRALSAGILPPPPPELHGENLNVEFVSMLAQAQRAIGTNSIDRYVMSLGQVAQFKPEVLDKFDPDQYAEVYADMLGVDPTLIVPADKVALVRNQRAQQQAAAQQAALMQAHADTASKLGQVQTQGGSSNAANDILNQFSGYGSPSPEQVGMAAGPGQ